jgi:L-ribulose-5-phosphate 3-epimerase
MTSHSRRQFLKASAAFTALRLLPDGSSLADSVPTRSRLGMFVYLDGKEPDQALAPVKQLGFPYCELYLNSFTDAYATKLCAALERLGLRATALFASGPGPQVYDFYQGPETIGLVPRATRAARVAAFKQASDFARQCGIPAFETHCGFIPENPNDPLYQETVEAIREVAGHCRKNGQTFLYHAGQETPVTLVRTIQDVGLDNQGVGLDTANLILCGKGHPLDALEVYGRHLKAVNAKDGFYPTNARELGKEALLGQGKVDFPRFLRRLKEVGYTAPIIIEREISGPQLYEDLKQARAYLEKLLGETP